MYNWSLLLLCIEYKKQTAAINGECEDSVWTRSFFLVQTGARHCAIPLFHQDEQQHRWLLPQLTNGCDTFTLCCQARVLLKQLKYQKQCQWAVGIIHKYFLGWKVRKEYRCKFRAIAGPKIVSFIRKALVSSTKLWFTDFSYKVLCWPNLGGVLCLFLQYYRYLSRLSQQLPSVSPVDPRWPPCAPLYRNTSEHLRVIYHRWRVGCPGCHMACKLRAWYRKSTHSSI